MADLDLAPLVQLGLTRLEAEIYTFLLEKSPATGYGIAKGTGKPTANTYKALESLHNKGAIIVDDSEARLCRAVPTDELLDNFQHRFETVRNQAQTEFRKLKAAPGDSRVYQLKTPEQLVQRYRKMLS
ncbi:MAG: TrmB family transcriptional regulator, partial [bacterium]|nr:TrmB family transcriptional regulator [bacterium]